MNDLRLMGESNCIIGRKPFLRRDVIARAEQIYKGTYLTANLMCLIRFLQKCFRLKREMESVLHTVCYTSSVGHIQQLSPSH